jgi:hypothetical protein
MLRKRTRASFSRSSCNILLVGATPRVVWRNIAGQTGWTSGGGSGGFAQFGPEGESPRFNVSHVFLGRAPTLANALAELQRGGADIQDVRDVDVSGHSALWVTLRPVAQMRFVVLMIAPDCGYGTHSLFISALEANQEQFQTFLSRIRFLRSSKADR